MTVSQIDIEQVTATRPRKDDFRQYSDEEKRWRSRSVREWCQSSVTVLVLVRFVFGRWVGERK